MKKKLLCSLALLCSMAQGQTSAPLLDVAWVDGAVVVDADRWAAASAAPTIWWRVVTSGMAFAEGGVSLSPAGAYRCVRQSDVRLVRCDQVGEAAGSSYAIRLVRTTSTSKSPPALPDGWIQSE